MLLSKGGKTENTSVKNSVIGTQDRRYFPKKEVNLNNPVKNSVNGTHGTVLFSYEREKTETTVGHLYNLIFLEKGEQLKIPQWKTALTVNRARCYFLKKAEI